jgi:hypothetical protein
VQLLATEIDVVVDVSCADAACVKNVMGNFTQRDLGANLLICWEPSGLADVVRALGVGSPAPTYPSKRFDMIWTMSAPYKTISAMTSESCPGLDVPVTLPSGQDGIGAPQPPAAVVPGIGPTATTDTTDTTVSVRYLCCEIY